MRMALKNFLYSILSGNAESLSHKRVVSLISLFMLILLSILSCFGHRCDIEFVYIFCFLTGGESMLVTYEKFGGRFKKQATETQPKL